MKWVKINVHQTGLVFRNGRYRRKLQPGKHWLGLGERAYIYALGNDSILLGHIKDIELIDQLRQLFC